MVLMRREVQAAVFGLPKEELLALLAREVEALLAGCAEVSLCVEADGYVLVPDALFRPRQLDDYFYFQHERDDRGLVLFDRVPRWGCVNVFSMPGVLYESLSEFFPEASPKHHVTGFLSRLGRERESQVALWMRTGCVDVAVVSGGRLLLANRFACHAVEDVVYSGQDVKSTKTTIPFFKNNNMDYAGAFRWLGDRAQAYGWILFVLVTIFIVTAVSNGANLTDGLDGLATGSSAIMGVTLGILAYLSGHVEYAGYLNIMYIPGAGELLVFAGAFIGATIGFLWYNSFPAQVFMGDTGSLMLGGVIAVFAVAIRKELLIPILCGVFLVESLSVIVQVFYFKLTKRRYGEGRRVFKMTPLHHHYQKPGNGTIQALIQRPAMPIPESKIVVRFWIVGMILAAVTIITLKIR